MKRFLALLLMLTSLTLFANPAPASAFKSPACGVNTTERDNWQYLTRTMTSITPPVGADFRATYYFESVVRYYNCRKSKIRGVWTIRPVTVVFCVTLLTKDGSKDAAATNAGAFYLETNFFRVSQLVVNPNEGYYGPPVIVDPRPLVHLGDRHCEAEDIPVSDRQWWRRGDKPVYTAQITMARPNFTDWHDQMENANGNTVMKVGYLRDPVRRS